MRTRSQTINLIGKKMALGWGSMDRSLVYHRGKKEDTKGKSEKSAFK
jgi:hypothetical protein